ncbi:hypothetical protein DESC_120060 [Desulfosarcina cetonica]|nr:hypothetical protein DESC_120060 [Desulfosarcina cetonica]
MGPQFHRGLSGRQRRGTVRLGGDIPGSEAIRGPDHRTGGEKRIKKQANPQKKTASGFRTRFSFKLWSNGYPFRISVPLFPRAV